MRMQSDFALLLVVAFVLSAGCTSIIERQERTGRSIVHHDRFYPGTQKDIRVLPSFAPDAVKHPFNVNPHGEGGLIYLLFGIVDFPFSFVLDTLLFPADYFHEPARPEPELQKLLIQQ
jgi:uncharacterized protein YceK